MDANTRLLVWSTGLLVRRAARERRRRLTREIAEYRTAAERDDLMAAVDRCPCPGREEVRRLLVQAGARSAHGSTPFSPG
jgi:hypothetical protein